jgi:ubiquilin
MFQNPESPDELLRRLEDPSVQQMMREAMNNPQFVDMMINQNPQLRQMPGVRQMLQSDYFRRMMTDPSSVRALLQLQQASPMGPFGGGGGGQGAFPAPGVTNTTDPNAPGSEATGQTQQQQPGQANPFAAFGGGGAMGQNPFASMLWPSFPPPNQQDTAAGGAQPNSGAQNEPGSPNSQAQQPPNPFAALFNPAMFGQPQQGANTGSTSPPPPNPFMPNLENLNQFMQAMGGAGAGAGAGAAGNDGVNYNGLLDFLGGGGGGAPTSPPDNRPPEERYATQLQQLNDMGFYDFDRNIQALRRTGGSVNGAIEYLLNNP